MFWEAPVIQARALQQKGAVLVRFGSWLRENSAVRRTDRMDHLSDCEFRRDDSNARSILIDLRKTVLRVFALAGFHAARVILPAIPACPVRPKSGHSAKAGVQPESRSLVRLSYATEVRFVAATALLPTWSRSFSTSFTRPWCTS
jgi:hypothetical protein